MRTDVQVMLLVPVEDLERARRFYELTLGLRLLQATKVEAWYECQRGTKMHLRRKLPKAENVELVWKVVDIDKMIRQLAKKGIVCEKPEDSATKGDPVSAEGQSQTAHFKDTEGNLVSLVQS